MNDFYYWKMPPAEVLKKLDSSASGLSAELASSRKVKHKKSRSQFYAGVLLYLSQFKSPLTLLLVFALFLSAILGDIKESVIILAILLISGFLSFLQERKAIRAAEKLHKLLQSKVLVRRDNKEMEIALDDVVPGDIVLLEAGDIVPADGLILESKDLYVNEGALTGESFPAEKKTGMIKTDDSLTDRINSVFRGTNVVSGTATVVAVCTGGATELGKIESELASRSEETAFELGIRKFGYMLLKLALLLAGIIIILNIWLGKKPLESVLFGLALSIGLTPEMLPAIMTATLSAGSKRLAEKKVLVKKLSSIQNLGAIDILCADKTGTLTEGEVKIHSCESVGGQQSDIIRKYAYLNAFFESGYPNPVDIAIKAQLKVDVSGYGKFDEVPYDFIRKRLSIVVERDSKHIMITKGALKNIIEICGKAEYEGKVVAINDLIGKITKEFEDFSAKGLRVIGLCYKDVTGDPIINKDDETDMIFLGYILLNDPPKKGIAEVISELKSKKVELKIITGDNTLVAESVARQIGIRGHRIMSGKELHTMSDRAIMNRVNKVDIFAETEPLQKERIVRALQKKGHVVGYLGDGINDATALKTADVGISVNNAADVARESADMILLEKELSVISEGITEGRKTYVNTLKYIFITISANFGNIFSVAGASMFLPFLPLLPSQILFTNFLTDIPALSVASDYVDEEMLLKPRRWDLGLIRKFMLVFGLESSLFDFLTFGVLLWIFHSAVDVFRTGWFIESVVTEVLILLVIRTRRTLFRSRVGKALLVSSAGVVALALCIPYIPAFAAIGFAPLPANVLIVMCVIAIMYGVFGEITKKILFKKIRY